MYEAELVGRRVNFGYDTNVSDRAAGPRTSEEHNRNASYASASNFKGESIVKTALQYLGAKYRSGHSGPNAFDCSGLTSFVYGKEGISISRSSRTQFQEGTPITDIASLKKGDLVRLWR